MKRIQTIYKTSILFIAVLAGVVLSPLITEGARITSSSMKIGSVATSLKCECLSLVSPNKSTSLVLAPQFPFMLLSGFDALELYQQKPDTNVAITDPNAPTRLFLDQNYPNPFRDATSITYGIPRNTYVTVTIHTVLGSPVRTLVSERQKAGIYTIKTSQPDLMPGLYFYRIQTEYGTLTRRLTISD